MAFGHKGVGRCAALDGNGKRCGREGVRWVSYHGDHELYGYGSEPWPSWVRIALCERHSEPERRRPNADGGSTR